MKITNNKNLPIAFYNMINETTRKPTPKSYGVTTLLAPTQLSVLQRRHFEKLSEDISDMTNLMFGTALHNEIKRYDKTKYSEFYLNHPIKDGYRLSGQIDLYDEEKFEVVDYKTCGSWKIMKGDFEDWFRQGAMYAWLLFKNGKIVEKCRFIAFIKDYSKAKSKFTKGYPEKPIYVYEFKITSSVLQTIEKFIYKKFDEIIQSENKKDHELVNCTDKDTWYTGDKYAVMKQGKSRAVKIFDTNIEASQYINEKKQSGLYINKRTGTHRRCDEFCPVRQFCSQYKNMKETI